MSNQKRDEDWAIAKKRFRLNLHHVQMAKSLGLNPKKRGKITANKQEPWKMSLPEFIEWLYQQQEKMNESKQSNSNPS